MPIPSAQLRTLLSAGNSYWQLPQTKYFRSAGIDVRRSRTELAQQHALNTMRFQLHHNSPVIYCDSRRSGRGKPRSPARQAGPTKPLTVSRSFLPDSSLPGKSYKCEQNLQSLECVNIRNAMFFKGTSNRPETCCRSWNCHSGTGGRKAMMGWDGI